MNTNNIPISIYLHGAIAELQRQVEVNGQNNITSIFF